MVGISSPDLGYTDYYKKTGEFHDSPDRSRASIIRRIADTLKEGIPVNTVLDIGSGPQLLENQLLCSGRYANDFNRKDDPEYFKRNFQFFTFDIADIDSRNLKAKHKSNVKHIRGDALNLPFPDGIFGLVVSNHAIDFLGFQALNEAFRVLHNEGKAIFYFHHPDFIKNSIRSGKTDDTLDYWDFLIRNNVLYSNTSDITIAMTKCGFTVGEIIENSDSRGLKRTNPDKWWEVVVHKIV